MKVLLLADIGSSHTEKWALGLASNGVEVGLFSFNSPSYNWFEGVENLQLLIHPSEKLKGNKLSEKLGYFKYLPELKRKIKEFKPDILHAHYASSYGLIGALSGFRPFIVSVWGSDVYEFPKKNIFNSFSLKYTLAKANQIFSTSHCMKKEALLYTSKNIEVIPFGIDVSKFNRIEGKEPLNDETRIVIGNIKSLEEIYGIDVLIETFHLFREQHPEANAQLLIVGDGTKRTEYEKLSKELNLDDHIVFTGKINHNEIPDYHRKIDVFVCLSRIDSESFGVSLVEAMASRSIVIASKVQGFSEILDYSDQFGYLVKKNNPAKVAEILSHIIRNKNEALKKTNAARQRVLELYDWNENLKSMISFYKELVK